MKKMNLFAGALIIALSFTSCKNENQARAEKTFDNYESYVDSVSNVAVADARDNWQSIEASYNTRISEAEAELENMKDRAAAEERLEKSKAKYAELKAKLEAEAAANNPENRKQILSSAYFKGGSVGTNLDFSWVNKDNILQVYQDFVDEFNRNKDSYTREDFDYIKVMYEALDTRKNTVEKEGLSGEDNRKIAALKLEFAPKFKWERMGAKADENADAKE